MIKFSKQGRANINFYNYDNITFMKSKPDNFYKLAIVDPEYGLGIDGQKGTNKGKKSDRKEHKQKGWDKSIPPFVYFEQLFRVSENQIIWGGNYFVEHLKEGHKGWIVWDKAQHGLTMSDCEIAYSSFDSPTRIWVQNRCILKQEGETMHPTQKPIKLYKWLLINYAKVGCNILDTNGGSASIALACWDLGFDLDLCELDEDYFNDSWKRFETHSRQQQLF